MKPLVFRLVYPGKHRACGLKLWAITLRSWCFNHDKYLLIVMFAISVCHESEPEKQAFCRDLTYEYVSGNRAIIGSDPARNPCGKADMYNKKYVVRLLSSIFDVGNRRRRSPRELQ